jgi:hypothetical protein
LLVDKHTHIFDPQDGAKIHDYSGKLTHIHCAWPSCTHWQRVHHDKEK